MGTKCNRRQFMTGIAAMAATGAVRVTEIHGQQETEKNKPKAGKLRNAFSVSMNCFGWGQFDIAQCITQIKKTPIRLLELPAEQARPKSLIPELMIDAPLGGQWQYSFPDLQDLLARNGFKAESVDLFGYTGYPGSDRIIKRRIDFAERIGAQVLVLGCHHKALGHKTSGDESQEQKDARSFMYAMLRDVADYAAGKNIKIALEIHGGIMANAREALRTMNEVNRPNLGVNFDTANIFFYNETFSAADAARELESLAKHVFHVHLKDIIRGQGKHVLPQLGKGEVDFRKVFDILHNAGFYGPFSFEVETFHGATQSGDINAYIDDLTASIETIKSIGEFDV
ncbi:MAG: sugar phosphate isomerase/epimerase [Kiritimatiellae bacterium]|nr:sugar phosphate isomerase/epimerase [Kiritimatiellia bacterium]MDD5522504.1 sugar phosphate isomerase/epimerase [Kiritimatiellia bacterium]